MSQWGGLSGEAREMENSYLRAPRRHLPEKQPLQAASSVVHDAGCCYPDTRPGPRSPNGLLPTRVCRQLSTYTHLLDHPPIRPSIRCLLRTRCVLRPALTLGKLSFRAPPSSPLVLLPNPCAASLPIPVIRVAPPTLLRSPHWVRTR